MTLDCWPRWIGWTQDCRRQLPAGRLPRSSSSNATLLQTSRTRGRSAGTSRRSVRSRDSPTPAPVELGSTLFGDDTLLRLVNADDMADGGPPLTSAAAPAAAESSIMPPPPTSVRPRRTAVRGGANTSCSGSTRGATRPGRGRRRRAGDRSRLMTTLEFTVSARGRHQWCYFRTDRRQWCCVKTAWCWEGHGQCCVRADFGADYRR